MDGFITVPDNQRVCPGIQQDPHDRDIASGRCQNKRCLAGDWKSAIQIEAFPPRFHNSADSSGVAPRNGDSQVVHSPNFAKKGRNFQAKEFLRAVYAAFTGYICATHLLLPNAKKTVQEHAHIFYVVMYHIFRFRRAHLVYARV